jgi:hypothetical protein
MNTEAPLPPGIPARQAQGRVPVYSPIRPTPRSSPVAGWEQAPRHLLVGVLSSSTLPITAHLLLFSLHPVPVAGLGADNIPCQERPACLGMTYRLKP